MTYLIGDTESQTIGDTESLTVGPVLQVSGDLQVSGNLTVNDVRKLDADAFDPDSSVAPLETIRELTVLASDADQSSTNITRLRDMIAAANDVDTAVADAVLVREIVATASDSDSSQTPLTRIRELDSDASDADNVAGIETERVRFLVASADNTDSAATVFLPVSTSVDSRETVIELLSKVKRWPDQDPIIKRVEDTTPKTRQNTTEPAIYVHKPVDDDITRFSAESLALEEDETVEIYIYILETEDETPPERAAREYRNRIVNVMSGYMNDNYTRTEFLYLEPTGATDARASTIARQTDHYVYSVEIETHRLAQRL